MDSKSSNELHINLHIGGVVEHPEKMLENLAGCPYEDGTVAKLYNFKVLNFKEIFKGELENLLMK